MGTGATGFQWRLIDGTGELEITNLKPNDARWIQKLHLEPGWYHFTGIMRAEGVVNGITGANLSLLEDGMISEQLHGSADWKQVGLYFKVGNSGGDVILACRLGGFAGLGTGKAFFRHLRLTRLDQPPIVSSTPSYIYDLDVIRRPQASEAPVAAGPNNTAGVIIVFLLAIVALGGLAASSMGGWRMLRRGQRPPSKDDLRPEDPPSSNPDPRATQSMTQSAERSIEITLFLVCLATYAYFYQASDHNTASRIDLIRAILERHTLWIDGYVGYNTADLVRLGPHTHIYSNKAPGGALTGLLPWLVATAALRLLTLSSAAYWTAATYLTTVLSISVISTLTAVLVYRLALHFGADTFRAVSLALALAFGTIMFPYATEFAGEPIAAFCELASFYLLAIAGGGEISWRRTLLAGLLAGWGVLCDYPTFLIALSIAGFAVWKLRRIKPLIVFATGAGVVAILLLSYNKLAFGNAFFLSYEAYMLPGADRFSEQAKGFAGVTYPRLGLLYNILISPQRGLLFCNPVLILLISGIYFFWRANLRSEFVTITTAIVVFVLFNASYGESIIYWGGGTATGPRHLMPIIPFMILALAFMPKRLNPLFTVLGLLSVFLMLMATAVEPHLPYEYTNPFRDFLWPALSRGDLGLNSSSFFDRGPIIRDSVAFNLGELIRLPGSLQLWPLGILWMGAAVYLIKSLFWYRPISRQIRFQIAACAAIAMLFIMPASSIVARNLRHYPRQGLLGCYYRGLHPARDAYPHIQRIDSQISFDSIVELGALPSPSMVIWRGSLIAPLSGLYHFTIQVDDLGWLKIDGKSIIADPGDVTKFNDVGTVELNAGKHKIEVGERNIWGDASMHLDWQPPNGVQQPVPSTFLSPDRGECSPG